MLPPGRREGPRIASMPGPAGGARRPDALPGTSSRIITLITGRGAESTTRRTGRASAGSIIEKESTGNWRAAGERLPWSCSGASGGRREEAGFGTRGGSRRRRARGDWNWNGRGSRRRACASAFRPTLTDSSTCLEEIGVGQANKALLEGQDDRGEREGNSGVTGQDP